MNHDQKIYGSIIGTVSTLFILSSLMNAAVIQDLFVLSFVLGGIGLAGKIIKDFKIREKIQQGRNGGRGWNYGIDECKEIAKEWAKENYKHHIDSKKGLSFDWTQSSSDPVQVYDFEEDEWFWVRYFYTPYGPKSKGTYIFVDADQGEVMTPRPVPYHDQKDDPYMYLEQYRLTKRFASRIRTGGDDTNNQPVYMGGIPLDSRSVQNLEGGE